MISFGAKTDQEVKEMGTCGSHFKKLIKNFKKFKIKIKRGIRQRRGREPSNFYFYFFLLSLLSSIYGNRIVGARTKRLYSTRATHENQKHRISPSFQLKIRKILCFDFSQIYGFLTVRIGRSRK